MSDPSAPSQVRALLDVIWDPPRLFKKLGDGLGIWAVLALLCAGSAIVAYGGISPLLQVMARDRSLEATPEQLERGIEFLKRFKLIIAELTPLLVVVRWTVAALLVWMACLSANSAVRYAVIFRLVVYASVIVFLHDVLRFGVMVQRARVAQTVADVVPLTGLDLIFTPGNRALAVLFASVNVFDVWFLLILAAGVRVLAKVSKTAAALSVIPVWVCFTGLQMLAATLGTASR